MSNLFNILATSQAIESISLAVSITVIVLLFITLTSLFYIYYRYYRKCIDNTLEDDPINKELRSEHKKYFNEADVVIADETLTKEEKHQKIEKFSEYLYKRRKTTKVVNGLVNALLIIFALLVLGITGFSLYARASGESFPLGDVQYVIIQTGSMETKNEDNTYLYDNDLNNQIEALSLIGIEKVTNEDQLELYDIVAYYNDEGKMIVHRIVKIEVEDNQTLYTLRGDANTYSDPQEIDLTFSEIVGKYNGFQNFPLGISLNYLRSNIGIITLSLAILLIVIYNIFDSILLKRIDERKKVIVVYIEEEIDERIDNSVCASSKEGILALIAALNDIIESSEENEREKRLTFMERLALADEELIKKYYILRDYLLIHGVKSRVSNSCDTYRLKKVKYVVITIRGKSLVLHLKLDLLPVQMEILHVKEDKKERYQEVPILFKVKSDLSLKRAKALIDMCLADHGVISKDEAPVGDKYNEEEDNMLEEDVLPPEEGETPQDVVLEEASVSEDDTAPEVIISDNIEETDSEINNIPEEVQETSEVVTEESDSPAEEKPAEEESVTEETTIGGEEDTDMFKKKKHELAESEENDFETAEKPQEETDLEEDKPLEGEPDQERMEEEMARESAFHSPENMEETLEEVESDAEMDEKSQGDF